MTQTKSRVRAGSVLFFIVLTGWLWYGNSRLPEPASTSVRDQVNLSEFNPILPFQEARLASMADHSGPKTAEIKKTSDNPAESAELSRKLQILDEIFSHKDDNDPRLDTQFKNLTVFEKKAFRDKYQNTKIENRNERGTLVFLLSQKLESEQDFDFLKKVVSEEHCNSLLNCTTETETPETSENGLDVTLEYPQIVAVMGIKTYLKNHPKAPQALEVLREAVNSKNKMAGNLAKSLVSN
jgi:hypothetical protein